MPLGKPLTVSMQDLLEKEVGENYFIPDTQVNLKENLPKQDVAYCLDANYHKGISVDLFIKKKRRTLVQVGLLPTKDKVLSVASRGRSDGKGGYIQRLEYRKDEVCNTLTTVKEDSLVSVNARVRRLTPIECWRLMGYSDEDFMKAKTIAKLSDTKLYERAGRGIIVPMLESIFKALLL